MAKIKKFVFANIPGVPGCTYYLTVGGQNRSLICIGNDDKTVVLSDLSTGYVYRWDVRHFSFMLRQRRWKDTNLTVMTTATTIGVTNEKLEVQHEIKPEKEFSSREYGQKELDELVDNIEDIEF